MDNNTNANCSKTWPLVAVWAQIMASGGRNGHSHQYSLWWQHDLQHLQGFRLRHSPQTSTRPSVVTDIVDINTDLGCRRASDPKAMLAVAQSQTSNSLRWQSTHFMLLPRDSMAYKCPSSVALVTDIILAPIRAWPGMGWQSQDWLTHQAACLHKPGPRWAWSLSCWLSPKLIIPILYTHSTTSAWLTDLFCKEEYSHRVGLLIKVKERRVAKSTPISRSTQECSMSMWRVDPPILNLYVIEVFE